MTASTSYQGKTKAHASDYAPVNGLNLYYEIHGEGQPLVLLHGGFGQTGMFNELIPQLTGNRQVIAVDLQAHGRTADIDRPMRLEFMADDIALLIEHLGFDRADVMGYSMGAGVALRVAIRHPERVRKLVVVSIPHKRAAWYPDLLPAMDQMSAASAPFFMETPIYQAYAAVAPDPGHFAEFCGKMGDMMRLDYDLSDDIAKINRPTLLVFGDADGVSPAQAAEFFGLLGGGKRDGSWDRSGMTIHRLAILPDTTHYDIAESPYLAAVVTRFLDAPMPAGG